MILNTWFYNLISILYAQANRFNDITDPNFVTDEVCVQTEVDELLNRKKFKFNALPDAFPDISKNANDIIEWCNEKNDYYVYRTVLCRLDSMINKDELFGSLDFHKNPYADNKAFSALNNNFDVTGFKVLPYVDSVKAYNPFGEKRARENAHTFNCDLNRELKNIYIVSTNELDGYSDTHIMYIAPDKNINKGYIRIALTPLLGRSYIDTINFKCYSAQPPDSTREARYFAVKSIIDPEDITKRFLNSYKVACKENCDIFIAPEMLGVDALVHTNANGTNPFYCPDIRNDYKTPILTLAPTLWASHSNKLHIFSQAGDLIGTQCKQHSFTYTDKDNVSWKEHLINVSKKILVIHIPGWGRFAFPICKDYLIPNYRKILVDTLKVNFLLCPSFSFGQYNFDISSSAAAEFETRIIHVNSCSALNESKRNNDGIGLVSTPITSLDRVQKIIPQCKGKCSETCVFIVDIPLNNGDQKSGATINHIY